MTVVRMKMCPPTEANGDDSGENEDIDLTGTSSIDACLRSRHLA